jgi:hypothetical protein
MSNVIIVGGGASGLVSAIFAARQKHKVTILEHKDKIGKKILATGNGKCNYTNYLQLPECYRSKNKEFPMKVLELFDVSKTVDFFSELGILPKDKKGYVYPNSEQAASVLEVLRLELEKLHVNIVCNVHVERIQSKSSQFQLTTNKGKYTADSVVLATGGCASPNLGSDGSGFGLAKDLGHKIITPLPALVQLKSSAKYFKNIAGVRTDASLGLYVNEQLVVEESGELLIANYGVSGIPIFQISRFASEAIHEKKKVYLKIDFLSSLIWKEAYDLIVDRINRNPDKTAEESLIGLFNNKLAYVMLMEAGINPNSGAGKLNKNQIQNLIGQIKEWKVPITEPNSFEQAQVSAGGVDTTEIYPDTLESKLVKGLYITGELMDVDGTCGGYNLQWAWSTGAIAGSSIR